MALFVEKGFAATRAEEIAERAGVSKGTTVLGRRFLRALRDLAGVVPPGRGQTLSSPFERIN